MIHPALAHFPARDEAAASNRLHNCPHQMSDEGQTASFFKAACSNQRSVWFPQCGGWGWMVELKWNPWNQTAVGIHSFCQPSTTCEQGLWFTLHSLTFPARDEAAASNRLHNCPHQMSDEGQTASFFKAACSNQRSVWFPYPCKALATCLPTKAAIENGYGCARKVMKTLSWSTPARRTCGRDVREQMPWSELHCLFKGERSQWLYKIVVGFFQRSPNWQKSKWQKFGS